MTCLNCNTMWVTWTRFEGLQRGIKETIENGPFTKSCTGVKRD